MATDVATDVATEEIQGRSRGRKPRASVFDPHHEELRSEIEAMAETELSPHAEGWEETTYPSWVFERLGELGYLGLNYPEEYGGQGDDFFSTLVLSEALAYSDSPGLQLAVEIHTHMAMPPILAFGTEAQKREFLAPAILGQKIGSLGITEAGAGSDVAGIQTRAVRDDDGWVIDGSKTYIGNGTRADFIVLLAKNDPAAGYDGLTLFLVDTSTPGFKVERRLVKLGMNACDGAELSFTGMRVPDSAVLGQVGKGFYHIMWELQGERLGGAAACTAGVQRLFDKTLEYVKQRTAFGRPIGSFQVNRHKIADMATKLETARHMIYAAAWLFANGEYPVREISMAKLHSARTACEVADDCLQLHGGAGYMRETNVERIWRDARLNRIGAGTDEIMLEVIGRSYEL